VHKVGHPVHIYSSGLGRVCQALGGFNVSEEHEAVQARQFAGPRQLRLGSGRWGEGPAAAVCFAEGGSAMRRTFWVLAAVVLAAFMLITSTAEAAKSITSPDMGNDVGQHTSMVLDGSGKPVISYYDATNGDLKVKHCYDTTCLSGMYMASPDTGGNVGQYTSLVLDSSGYPVISYYDVTGGNLKVLHCSDANCWGGSPNTPDTGGDVGRYTSLALDGSGYPVVSYYDATNHDLKVMHCNDANCDPAVNGAESMISFDTGGDIGQYTSLALSGGNPVVSYYDATNGDLKVLHCTNSNCSSGNIINTPDAENVVGAYTSLALVAGNPVVSYYHVSLGELRVMHCNDANCADGNESIASPDTAGTVGAYTSLALDGSNPVVSYYDLDNGDLKVLHCGNTDCTSGNTIASPETMGDIGQYTSVAVSGGKPAVSYYDVDHATLKMLRCGNASCTADNTTFIADYASGFAAMSLKLDGAGKPVVGYYDIENDYLKLMHCNDPNCAGGDESIVFLDYMGALGNVSMALDGSGYPVIAYYDQPTGHLNVLHCDDANCAGDESGHITTPDPAAQVGTDISLKLDENDHPVISYYDGPAGQLKLLHCDDVNCSGDETGNMIHPDTGLGAGTYTSLVLDTSGYPVISYYDYTQKDLKVTHCGSGNCIPYTGNKVSSPDTGGDVGMYTSLALDASGYPVVSYYDNGSKNLKVMHCNDVDCYVTPPSGPESIESPDQTGDVGMRTSLALDGSGYPVISYYDVTNHYLKVLHCDDVNCAGDESGNITVPDAAGGDGRSTSLALDSNGYPVVSYEGSADLKMLHCGTPSCTVPSYPPAGTDEMPVSLHFANVWLDEDDNGVPETPVGAVTFSGTGKFSRGTPYPSGEYNTIDTAITSMVLTGTVAGYSVTIKAGTEQGLPASLGKIRERTPGTLYPADTWFDLLFEVDSADSHYGTLWNCNGQSVRLNGVTMAIPAAGVDYLVPSCPLAPPPASCAVACQGGGLLGDGEVMPMSPMRMCTGYDPAGNAIWVSVGGIAEWPGTAAGPDSLADSSAGSGFNYTALGAALGTVAVALAAGAWFARRRWTR